MNDIFYIQSVNSTNILLAEMLRESDLLEGFVVCANFQTMGRGQQGNLWESGKNKNLLFSILLYPKHVSANEQFLISQAVSIGIKRVLDKYVENISIKWPNDIFWNDRKIAGILIENALQGNHIKHSIVGIGININQTEFHNAPNAISLKQITGKSHSRTKILQEICESILNIYHSQSAETIRAEYMQMLYRKIGYFSYSTQNETFEAKIAQILPDGRLELQDRTGEKRNFYFKEIQFS